VPQISICNLFANRMKNDDKESI